MQPNYIPIFQKALKKTKNCLAKELEFHGDVDSSGIFLFYLDGL